MSAPTFSRSRHLKRPRTSSSDRSPNHFAVWRGLAAIVVSVFALYPPFQPPSTALAPEPIVRTRAAHHVYSTGERVSLVDFLAAEVRRARRREARSASQPVLGLTEVEVRRRKEEEAARRAAVLAPPAAPYSADSIAAGYWRGEDAAYSAAMSIDRSTLSLPVVGRILVATASRAVFCPVPGVADGVVRFLERAEGVAPGALPSLESFSVRDRERFLTSSDIMRFVFVRHPFVRAAASYTDGVQGRDLSSPEYRAFMGRVRGRNLTDTEHELQRLSMLFFLTFLGRQKTGELDDEFLPQVHICAIDGSINYGMVLRQENFEDDIQKLAQQIGIDTSVVDIPTAAGRDFSQDLPEFENAMDLFSSPKHRTKASKLYGSDLIKLGYSPTNPPTDGVE